MKHLALLALFAALPAYADIEGYDWNTSNYVEIDATSITEGDTATMYDYDTGDYHDISVESVDRYGLSVEAEVYDYTTSEYRTLDLEK